mgnify:CR=1 FL=1
MSRGLGDVYKRQTLSFEFRPLGGSDSDAVEVLNQGQRLAYSTTMPE